MSSFADDSMNEEGQSRRKKKQQKQKRQRTSDDVTEPVKRSIQANMDGDVKRKKDKTRKKRKSNAVQDESELDGIGLSQLVDDGAKAISHKPKKLKKKKMDPSRSKLGTNLSRNRIEDTEDDVYQISSGDEDCSRGMRKWLTDYHKSRPGLKVLQEKIDDFITAHEERLEKEREEREAKAAEGGWTVVVHHKGRKKTTDSETGITVGSVAQAAVEDRTSKKKKKVVAPDFYRFQKREAHRNEIMMLQSKFEEDKKRIQQLRAARKFKPY